MTRRRLAAIVLVSSCAILVVGCGGGGSSRLSAAEYKARLATISQEADQAQSAVGQALNATTVAAIESGVTAFADAEDKLGDEVAKLKAPKDADAANTKLAKGLHDLASEIRVLLPDLRKQISTKAAVAFLDKNLNSAPGARSLDTALSELKTLGYTTGS